MGGAGVYPPSCKKITLFLRSLTLSVPIYISEYGGNFPHANILYMMCSSSKFLPFRHGCSTFIANSSLAIWNNSSESHFPSMSRLVTCVKAYFLLLDNSNKGLNRRHSTDLVSPIETFLKMAIFMIYEAVSHIIRTNEFLGKLSMLSQTLGYI